MLSVTECSEASIQILRFVQNDIIERNSVLSVLGKTRRRVTGKIPITEFIG
ncbi:MAG: hypothetical protein RIG63_26500 [Coleofasciculus chthonoplastes F3-SA18-01]